DDSQLFAPPPVAVDPEPTETPTPKRLKALLTKVSKPTVSKRLVLKLSFHVARKAKVQLIATRGGRTVAKTPYSTVQAGRHPVRLQLSRKHWPTGLRFRTKELTLKPDTSSGSGTDTTSSSASTTIG